MGLMNLGLFDAIGEKMRWHQTRQGLLAENVANAETPGYRGRDLAPFSLDGDGSRAGVTLVATRPGHISIGPGGTTGQAGRVAGGFEVTPQGNGVTLEDEMMKVTANMMDYQAATSLYQKSVKILRVALGRQA